ncbi:hypothetical protein HWHPT5561_08175 [Petrotoga sp. HWH.PT.55.6.1]|uniref:hypothetical protein n=1 Tax=unclassified Petrotoga TaxID=2620614 RepID=UPI000CA028CE|nr:MULTISPECIES: hypothetical protein [unclassified Petrotoga]MBL5981468.1 hypothetical protein [Petrotoga sp. 8T1HF07.NaAc.6.1]PNR92403.1 hypothetical protein X926_06410 [Petrotoga sp. HWHPT.55.6.3]RPD35308.1 hypothetical protein HWHPT5561_08175 [Petrotoga sp. HWH.PT.55.6.1]
MIPLKEKLIMKTLYHKFNDQLPHLETEISYKRGNKHLFFVLYALKSTSEKLLSHDLIKNGNELIFTLEAGKEKHNVKLETKESYKSYYFVSINDNLNIDEFVEIEPKLINE